MFSWARTHRETHTHILQPPKRSIYEPFRLLCISVVSAVQDAAVCACEDVRMFPGSSISSDSDGLKPRSDRIYFSGGGSDLISHVLISDINSLQRM